MGEPLLNCWELMNCGREQGGRNVAELGECLAARRGFGHSCWAIAGTLCGGEVQGTAAQKERSCMQCKVFRLYNRQIGTLGDRIPTEFPDEHEKYSSMLRERIRRAGYDS